MKLQKLSTPAYIAIGMTVLTVIGIGVILAVKDSTLASMSVKYKENFSTIDALKTDFASLGDSDSRTVEEIKVQLSSAATAGETVASLQNKYRTLDASTTEGTKLLVENANTIGSYLSDTSKRIPWYNGGSRVNYKWEFESTFSFSGNTVPVLWVCKEQSTTELLAYATGVYDVSLNKFKDVSFHMTQIGSTKLGATTNTKK